MTHEYFPAFIDGRFFPDGQSYHDHCDELKHPTHELLTAEEACRYLRLDVGRDIEKAIKALNRLVDRKLLRPCRIGKYRRYSRRELDRFIKDETDRYHEVA